MDAHILSSNFCWFKHRMMRSVCEFFALTMMYVILAQCAPAQAAVTNVSYAPVPQYNATDDLQENKTSFLQGGSSSGESIAARIMMQPQQHSGAPQVLQTTTDRHNAVLAKMALNVSLSQQLPMASDAFTHVRWRSVASLAQWVTRARGALRMGLENGTNAGAPSNPATRWYPSVTLSKANFRANVRWYLGRTH
jgi:hypothetical protein